MHRHAARFVLLFCWIIFIPLVCAQETAQQAEASRRVVSRVSPEYPAVALTMRLAGTVKVEAVVQPNGTVKEVEIKGGHPVLAKAAAIAVRKWRWAPSGHETKELVEVRFDPNQ